MSKKNPIYYLGKKCVTEKQIIETANDGLAVVDEKGKKTNKITELGKAIDELTSRGFKIGKK